MKRGYWKSKQCIDVTQHKIKVTNAIVLDAPIVVFARWKKTATFIIQLNIEAAVAGHVEYLLQTRVTIFWI